MRKGLFQVVFLSLIVVSYYGYNIFLDHIGEAAKDELAYQILSPFRLIFVGMMFGIIFSSVKTIFFSKWINEKKYKQQRRNFILFEFENTILFLEKLKANIDSKKIVEIKSQLKSYSGVVYKPVFLEDLIDNISISLVSGEETSQYINQIDLILKNIKNNFELEKVQSVNKKSSKSFDQKRVNDYYSPNSWQYVEYLFSNTSKEGTMKWKISSLNTLRFLNSLSTTLIFTTILMVILETINIFAQFISTRWLICIYVSISYFASLILFVIDISKGSKEKGIQIFWSNIFILILFTVGITANVIFGIFTFPTFSLVAENWYEKQLLMFLYYCLYIVLTTLILCTLFMETLDILSNKNFKVIKLIVNLILPIGYFVAALIINSIFLSTKDNNYLYANLAVLGISWLAMFIGRSYLNIK